MQLTVLGGGLSVDGSLVAAPAGEIRRQVEEFERGERRAFDLRVDLPDSYTGRVMRAMLAIPFGETRTYGALAAALDTAPVAVGGACGRNPVPLLVPCHRVVAADGSLGGYSAPGGRALKRRLLEHERRAVATGSGAGPPCERDPAPRPRPRRHARRGATYRE